MARHPARVPVRGVLPTPPKRNFHARPLAAHRHGARATNHMTQPPEDTPTAALTLEALTVRLAGRVVLRDVELAIPAGACVAIVGPGGAGKTTLLRAIAGVLPIESGIVRLGGPGAAAVSADRAPASPAAKRAGTPAVSSGLAYLPQDLGLWDAERVHTHLAIATRHLPREARRALIADWLERVDLTAHARRRAAELSGGERRRLAIARTLAYAEAQTRVNGVAPLVLLDEPFASLDVLARDAFSMLLSAFRVRSGATLLATSHLREQVVAIADHAIVLETGAVTTPPPGCVRIDELATNAGALTPFALRFFELTAPAS